MELLFTDLQSISPATNRAVRCAAGEPLTALPCAAVCHLLEQFATLAHTGGSGGCKRNDSLAGEVVVLDEIVDRPCRNTPPDGITDEYGVGPTSIP